MPLTGREIQRRLMDRLWPWFALAVAAGFAWGQAHPVTPPARGRAEKAAVSAPVPAPSPLESANRTLFIWRRASPRVLPPPTSDERSLTALAGSLGAPGGRVENPCARRVGGRCERTALEPFFDALDQQVAGAAFRPTVVTAFGNSLIAGDRIVDVVRDRFGRHFGASGRGLLLIDRFMPVGPRDRCGWSDGGWRARTLADFAPREHRFGIAGTYHVAEKAGARSRFKLEGERRGTLWWLDVREGGQLSVRAGATILARPERRGDGSARESSFDIPADAAALEVVAEGAGAVALNLVLEHDRPGVVLDNAGVPAADASLFLRADDALFRQQLQARAPRLSMFLLGGNETKRLQWRRTNLESVESGLRDMLRRVRAAAPQSACLVVGPIDAVVGKGPNPMAERPWLGAVIALERETALAEGCAFFDLYAAMGGAGSLARFRQAGLVYDDLVHPRGRGLDLLGHLVSDALMRSWAATPRPDAVGGALAWEEPSRPAESALCTPARSDALSEGEL